MKLLQSYRCEEMSNDSTIVDIGEIVEILMGRDKGKFAIIIGVEDVNYVNLVDGDKRKIDNPKRKNLRHIKTTGYISKEIVDHIKENAKISNAKLRYVLQDYISNHLK